jgi:biopolymer transport protein ExbB/TolQ
MSLSSSEIVADPQVTPVLSWEARDIERWLGFNAGRNTSVNIIFAFILAAFSSVSFYALLYPYRDSIIGQSFFNRGIIPFFVVFFTFWSLSILLVKWTKLAVQRRSLQIRVLPEDPQFVLSPSTVEQVTDRIFLSVDDPRKFVLFNRIIIALSNLRNIGRVADVDEILRAQGENDASSMETSYYIVQVFVWAIPVLGFIGTVLGLSQAIGGFGGVLAASEEMSELRSALQEVTAGLSTAFETTLHGLVAALAIQLLLTALKKAEEEFLDDCSEYCIRNVVSRLRLIESESRSS